MSDPADSIQRLLKEYHEKVRTDVKQMRLNYQSILTLASSSLNESKENIESLKSLQKDPNLKAASSKDSNQSFKSKTNMTHLEIQTKTNEIIKASHSLLDLTAELKTLIIISDLSSQNLSKEEANLKLEQRNATVQDTLLRLKDDIYSDLYSLESYQEDLSKK